MSDTTVFIILNFILLLRRQQSVGNTNRMTHFFLRRARRFSIAAGRFPQKCYCITATGMRAAGTLF